MMDDLISRRAAIDACNDLCERNCGRFCACTQDYIDEIRKIPSAQKKGHWVQNDNGTWSCSNCQSWIPKEQHYYARFCLHCGADMRGDDNG